MIASAPVPVEHREPENEQKPEKGRYGVMIWTILKWLFLIGGLLWSGSRLLDLLTDDSAAVNQAYEMQAACANAGLSTDQDGNCYARGVDPRLLDDATRAAAIVPPPPASEPDLATPIGPEAPGAPVLVVPPAPAGSDNSQGVDTPDPRSTPTAAGAPIEGIPEGLSPTGDGGGGFESPTAPVAPLDPNAPVSPDDPNAPADAPKTNDDPGDAAATDDPEPIVVRETIRITQAFNIQPDPRRVPMPSTGGAVDVSSFDVGCAGWSGSDPDIVLTYTDVDGSQAGSSGLPLRVLVEADGSDTTLIVNDPYGRWYCNDNWAEGKIDPLLTFLDAGYGIYDIWVGTNVRGTGPAARVYITERPLTPTD